MMKTATYYHAGCPVCTSAEETLVAALDATAINVRRVHLGESPNELAEAERAGVQSVPALVLDGQVFHINHGADLAVLKN